MKWITTIILGFLMVSLVGAIDYTPSSTTICDGGVCTLTQYSGTQFVFEDDTWKKWDEARSLLGKGFDVSYIENDPDYIIEVIDFNATSIEVDLNPKGLSIFPNTVPVRTWKDDRDLGAEGKNRTGDFKLDYRKTRDQDVSFNLLNQKQRVKYDFSVGDLLEFGPESTTIELSDANTENLDDTYIDEAVPTSEHDTDAEIFLTNRTSDSEYILIKYNISAIPAEGRGTNITNADLLFEISGNTLDSGDSFNVTANHLYSSFGWNEETMNWNNKPDTTDYNTTYSPKLTLDDSDTDGWISWNVTTALQEETANNVSFYLFITEKTGTILSTDRINVESKEGTNKPILNITYTTPIIEDSYGCTYSTGDWYINGTQNCTISSNVDVGGNNIYCNATGTFQVNDGINISNWAYRKFDSTCYYLAYGSGGFR